MVDPKRKTRKGKKVVRIPLTGDQQQKAEQLVADSLKDNPDIFNLPDRLITMVIKLSDTLKADETELELLGEVELPQFTIGEQSTWKI